MTPIRAALLDGRAEPPQAESADADDGASVGLGVSTGGEMGAAALNEQVEANAGVLNARSNNLNSPLPHHAYVCGRAGQRMSWITQLPPRPRPRPTGVASVPARDP